jgi:hypothetical protein
MNYEIIGYYKNNPPEILDHCSSREYGFSLRKQFQKEFGNEWRIIIKRIIK